MKIALAFISLICFSLVSVASLVETPRNNEECGSVQLPSLGNLKYCFSTGSLKHPILYFHGISHTEYAWTNDEAQSLWDSFARIKVAPPAVLTVSMGPVLFLSGHPARSGMTDIEEITLGFMTIAKKLNLTFPLDLYGESMGGANATQVFTRHPELFRKVVLGCPAMTRVSPFAPFGDWWANRAFEGAQMPLSIGFRQALQFYYGDADTWNSQSPLLYLKNSYQANKFPQPIFIGSVNSDRYGFDKIQSELVSAFQAKGHSVIRTKTEGDHCYIDTLPVANFLSQP